MDISSIVVLMVVSESICWVVVVCSCGVLDVLCSWGMEVFWMCVRKGRELLG